MFLQPKTTAAMAMLVGATLQTHVASAAPDASLPSNFNINCETGLPEEVKPAISFKLKRPKDLYTFEFTELTPDDLSYAPKAHYLGKVPQPLIVSFNWLSPTSISSPRDERGVPTDQVQHGLLSFFSPLLGLDAGYFYIQGGEGPLGFGTAVETGKFRPAKTTRVVGDPSGVTCDPYTFETKSKSSTSTFSTKQQRYVTDRMDLTFDYMPYGMKIKPGYLHQPAYIHGTINGQPVEALGGFDRGYGLTIYLTPLRNWGDALYSFSGRGVDGKFEYGWVSMSYDGRRPDKGPRATLAFFHREGEAPVASNDVEIVNLEWGHGKGMNLGRAIPTAATFRFGGKELTFQGTSGYYPVYNHDINGKPIPALPRLIAEVLGIVGVTDTACTWHEKNSPMFNLSWCGAEAYFMYDRLVK